jgi:hypothetical protein
MKARQPLFRSLPGLMASLWLALSCAGIAAQGREPAGATHAMPAGREIADRYIVVFKPEEANPDQEADNLMRGSGGQIHHRYSHAIKGFAATIPATALDCSGSGSLSGVIAGVDWVAGSAARPGVANLSLGSSKSLTVNAAVAGAYGKGVTMVVAAGNSNADACLYSPDSEPSAITVGGHRQW